MKAEIARRIIENGGLPAKDSMLYLVDYIESADRKIEQLIADRQQEISELAAAQRERDGYLHSSTVYSDRAFKAEAELKRRDAQEPDGHIFCHPNGKLFWSVSDDSNAGRNGVRPFYFAAPDVVHENALLPDHKFRECVNGLLEEAIAYAGTQQLRARLSSRLSNFVQPQRAAGVKYEVKK